MTKNRTDLLKLRAVARRLWIAGNRDEADVILDAMAELRDRRKADRESHTLVPAPPARDGGGLAVHQETMASLTPEQQLDLLRATCTFRPGGD